MSDVLRSDSHELFAYVRDRLNERDPTVPVVLIAKEIGVTVDELCRWFIEYRAPRKAKAYQSPRFPAIGAPKNSFASSWSQDDNARRFIAWKRQRDGAKAAREAANA